MNTSLDTDETTTLAASQTPQAAEPKEQSDSVKPYDAGREDFFRPRHHPKPAASTAMRPSGD